MITVKFIGGAKKSFPNEQLSINLSEITIEKLIDLLIEMQPDDFPKLDTENILIAVNGVDSSALDGRLTILKDNDLISIIPTIHGGSSNKINFKILTKQIQILQINGKKTTSSFIDNLREKYPKIQFQAISSNFVLNQYHLEKILAISLESAKNNILLSNKLEVDILMRFALTSQISSAIDNAGIKPHTDFILIAIGNKKILDLLYGELSPVITTLFSKNNSAFLQKYFEITQKQLDAAYSKHQLEDTLIEKAAILF